MKLLKLYEGVLNESEAQHCVDEIEHLLSNIKMSRPDFVKGVQSLKKCISKFPEMIQPEGSAYKGVDMPLTELLSQYDDITDDKKKGGKFNFIYTSNELVQLWSLDRDDVEKSVITSPNLLTYIDKFKAGDITELINNLNEITVPVIITIDASPDDFLLKGKYFEKLSDDNDDLVRVNNQPKRVKGKIVDSLFDTVYDMLTAIKRFQLDKSK